MNRTRRWVRRVVLSALAGGGLTAAGLGAPLGATADASGVQGAATPTTGSDPAHTSSGSETGTTSLQEATSSTTTSATTTTSESTTSTGSTTSSPAPVPTPSVTPEAPAATDSQGPIAQPAPVVQIQRRQLTTEGSKPRTGSSRQSSTQGVGGKNNGPANVPSNVALPPQLIAAQSEALAALLGGSKVSVQALSFYRIPLFLLPIYQAAAIQYGVPWQILAAINEVETDYGSDLAVSSAGAVGWMQFMPSTWLQYGVDVDDAGYADPANPIDAIFAAARYLRAAGASKNLRGAIFAYNHSQAYVESVILRAKLITDYPRTVLATLTGLADGVMPVTGAHVVPGSLTPVSPVTLPSPSSEPSSATAGATLLPSSDAQAPAEAGAAVSSQPVTSGSVPSAQEPGSSKAPSPSATVASLTAKAKRAPQQFVKLTGPKNAPVVAVQDGRVVQLGRSDRLGKYLMLRDVYGDLFTYAGLGSIVPSYLIAPDGGAGEVPRAALAGIASAEDRTPTKAASAGSHPSVTLHVKTSRKVGADADGESGSTIGQSAVAPSAGKVRLFAHPDNPYALAAKARAKARAQREEARDGMLPLRLGSVVSQGTVLGHLASYPGSPRADLRFAISPAKDSRTIDPSPVIESWHQLDAALHPRGAKGDAGLLGATAADVFLLSHGELVRAVLSDPGIRLNACDRQDIATGAVDNRVLAALAFLSRSGLKPTVGALACGLQGPDPKALQSSHQPVGTIDIQRINGVAIAGHQGAGTITDLTIRTLLTLQGKFAPSRILSLMEYPGAHTTRASRERWNRIEIEFASANPSIPLQAAATARAAHSAGAGPTAPAPVVISGDLNPVQWSQLIDRIGALPNPTVSRKPSSAAIRDPQAAPSNRDLGMHQLP